jgi:hypothetical protein
MKDEALKLALEALKYGVVMLNHLGEAKGCMPLHDAITAIKQARSAPVAAKDWEGAEYWMPLAWELCADECGEEACTELIWEGGPIPEPWGERWLKYEDEAKRLIALVQKHTTPPAAPIPDAITDDSESPEYRTGWNDCRAEMLKAREA